MNNLRLRHILFSTFAILSLIICHHPASAKNNEQREARDFAGKVANSYKEWSTLGIDGKIDIDGIPLRPSVKIFMQKGQSISISVKAPFLGEVGRVEIEGDRITAINKMKKVYCSESVGDLGVAAPLTVSDIQDILLARVFIAGKGTLNTHNIDYCETMRYDSENWFIVPPAIMEEEIGVDYGFNLDPEGKLRLLYATDNTQSMSLSAEYSYSKKNTEIEFLIDFSRRQFSAGLILGKPDSRARRQDPINITTGGYRQVGIKEFLKSF